MLKNFNKLRLGRQDYDTFCLIKKYPKNQVPNYRPPAAAELKL